MVTKFPNSYKAVPVITDGDEREYGTLNLEDYGKNAGAKEPLNSTQIPNTVGRSDMAPLDYKAARSSVPQEEGLTVKTTEAPVKEIKLGDRGQVRPASKGYK